MPKQVNLLEVPRGENPPYFRVPKWLKPRQIRELMEGCVSSSEDEHEEVQNQE